jgi:hypothetical protein
MKQTKTANRARRLGRRLLRALVVLAIVAVVGAVIFKLHLGPYLLEQRVREALAPAWAGTIHIDSAELNLSGPSRVHGLRLTDAEDRQWLRVNSASLVLADLGRLAPTLREVELAGVECSLHFADGRCRPPLRAARGSGKPPTLTRLTAEPMTVRIVPSADPASLAAYEGLRLSLTHNAGRYDFMLSRKTGRADELLQADGTYHAATGTLHGRLSLSHAAEPAGTSALFRALGWTRIASAQGKLTASVTFSGPPDRPAEAKHSVDLTLADLRLDAPNGTIAHDINLSLTAANGKGTLQSAAAAGPPGKVTLEEVPFTYDLAAQKVSAEGIRGVAALRPDAAPGGFWRGLSGTGQVHLAGSLHYEATREQPLEASFDLRAEDLEVGVAGAAGPVMSRVRWERATLNPRRLEVAGLSARSCGGTVKASGHVENWTSRAKQGFQVALTCSGIDLAELSRRLNEQSAGKLSGKMDLELSLTGGPFAWPGLAGRGKTTIRGADFWSVPLLASVFGQLRLPHKPATISDLRAVFDIEGPIVRIRRAVVANKLAGIECTGGTVDLQTGDVDLTVVAGTFLTMNRLSKLLLAEAKTKVFGRRVKGKWGRIGSESFSPLPAEKIADGSIRFLSDLARGGGTLPQGIIKAIEDLFRSAPSRPR